MLVLFNKYYWYIDIRILLCGHTYWSMVRPTRHLLVGPDVFILFFFFLELYHDNCQIK